MHLKLLSQIVEKLLDSLTNYVISQGVSSKIRELKTEFVSKLEFKNAQSNFATVKDIKITEKNTGNLFKELKDKIEGLELNKNEIENGVKHLNKILMDFTPLSDFNIMQ